MRFINLRTYFCYFSITTITTTAINIT